MLNFRQGGDTGYNEDDSVQPYSNGEDATQTVFRRTPENLRARHEVLRKAFDNLEAVVSSDRGLRMMSDPDVFVTWNGVESGPGDGKFSITTAKELRIVPIISTAGEGAGDATLAQLRYEPVGASGEYFRIRSDKKAHEGGNNIFFELTAGAALAITVEGSEGAGPPNYDPAEGSVAIRATYVANVTTWADLVTAINADADASGMATAWAHATPGAAKIDVPGTFTIAYQRLSDGTGTRVVGFGGIDAEGFVLTTTQIATFFTGDYMNEGDTLVLDFVDAVTRRTQVESDDVSGALQVVKYGAAAIATDDPQTGTVANLHTVPICKVFNGNLHFLNGTVVGTGGPVSMMKTDSPFVIVGPGGHHATVQAAITALGTTGGTIFIKSGIYTENLTLSNIHYDIILIGEGVDVKSTSKGVVLINSGASDLLHVIGTGISARTIFENVRFEQDNAAGRILAADCEAASERARVTFRDCAFLHTSATDIADGVFDHSINLEFFDCYFKGTQDTNLNKATVFRPYAKTNPGIAHLRVERCYFEKFAEIAEIGKAATQVNVGSFVFNDNVIHECGLTTAVGVIGLLIKGVSADFYAKVEICRNRWSTGTTDAASGCFCKVYGKGTISHNVLNRGILGHVPAGDAYMITALNGTGQTAKFLIENNFVEPYRGNIIETQNALVRGNYTENFYAGGTAIGYKLGDETIAVGNVISVANPTSAANVLFAAWSAGGRCKIADNIITGLNLNDTGILADAPKITITGNTIVSEAASYVSGVGIKVEDLQCVVAGNQIDDMCIGVELTVSAADGDNIVANNIIRMGDNDASCGVEIDANCNGNAILGNVIRGGASAVDKGISLNACINVALGGNMITACNSNIDNAGANCGLGATGNPTLDHNWF